MYLICLSFQSNLPVPDNGVASYCIQAGPDQWSQDLHDASRVEFSPQSADISSVHLLSLCLVTNIYDLVDFEFVLSRCLGNSV